MRYRITDYKCWRGPWRQCSPILPCCLPGNYLLQVTKLRGRPRPESRSQSVDHISCYIAAGISEVSRGWREVLEKGLEILSLTSGGSCYHQNLFSLYFFLPTLLYLPQSRLTSSNQTQTEQGPHANGFVPTTTAVAVISHLSPCWSVPWARVGKGCFYTHDPYYTMEISTKRKHHQNRDREKWLGDRQTLYIHTPSWQLNFLPPLLGNQVVSPHHGTMRKCRTKSISICLSDPSNMGQWSIMASHTGKTMTKPWLLPVDTLTYLSGTNLTSQWTIYYGQTSEGG